MNRKFHIVISSLIYMALLFGCSFPVQAAACTHPAYADGVEPEATGIYDYREDGHYRQYGVPHVCLKCDWTFYTDTYYAFLCNHLWFDIPFETTTEGGFTTKKYHCVISDCPRVNILINGVQRRLDSF